MRFVRNFPSLRAACCRDFSRFPPQKTKPLFASYNILLPTRWPLFTFYLFWVTISICVLPTVPSPNPKTNPMFLFHTDHICRVIGNTATAINIRHHTNSTTTTGSNALAATQPNSTHPPIGPQRVLGLLVLLLLLVVRNNPPCLLQLLRIPAQPKVEADPFPLEVPTGPSAHRLPFSLGSQFGNLSSFFLRAANTVDRRRDGIGDRRLGTGDCRLEEYGLALFERLGGVGGGGAVVAVSAAVAGGGGVVVVCFGLSPCFHRLSSPHA